MRLLSCVGGSFCSQHRVKHRSFSENEFVKKLPRVLLIRLRYLGDVILLEPVLRALRQAQPQTEIHVAIPSGAIALLQNNPHDIQVHGWNDNRPVQSLRVICSLRPDVVVDLTGSDRSALIALGCGAQLRVAYEAERKIPWWSVRRWAFNKRVPLRKPKPHIVVQHLHLLNSCELTHVDCEDPNVLQPKFELEEDFQNSGRNFRTQHFVNTKPIVLAHLTSRDMQKAIPGHISVKVIEKLHTYGAGVILSIGPSEMEKRHLSGIINSLSSQASSSVKTVSPRSFLELCGIISACDVYWGADTAPMHAAAALGLPVLAHFGPSNFKHWSPLGKYVHVDVHDCPCLRKPVTCQKDLPGKCLTGIDAEKTANVILDLAAQRNRG